MDAIDPNKLQKDVNKEKNIKLAKKRIRGAISGGFAVLVIVAFLFLVFPDIFPFGGLRKYEEPAVTEAAANQKFNAAATGSAVGKVKYSYPELNRMLKAQVVVPISEMDSFAKVTDAEVTYDEEKNQPVIYLWISIKDKVPVVYTIHGDIVYNTPEEGSTDAQTQPLSLDVKRLDIGRLPVFVSTHSFLNGFLPLLDNDSMANFFARAKSVEFGADGMTVDFSKNGPTTSLAPAPKTSSAPKASASAGVSALKSGSTAAVAEKKEADNAKAEAARAKAEAAKQKAAEEKEKQKQLEEERKRKAEEYRQQQKEKEEERKRKLEEEKERKQREKEERERQIREENERRRQEREDRRRDRQNNNYNNNNRNSRSSRNRY